MEARGAIDGERKTITALFADLKGSTALIEGLDLEDARSIIDPALQLMMDAVHRYEGYVAQALGDGILALFGAPIAHEDHPQRALYAALRMQEEMRRYADRLREQGRPPLLMRVGVNTGEVVVRSIRKEDLHTDYVPVGHSINLAARMEQLAVPGSILVTEQSDKLTAGYFEFKALGKTQIKGVEEPLKVYEVIGAGPLRTRLQVAARTLADPSSLALALFGAASFHQVRREGQETQEQAEALLRLSTEQGFPFWVAWGTILQGWALAEQGQGEEGIAQMRHGLTASQATGTELQRSYWLALLAEVYGKAGQAEAGLAALTEALTVVDNTGERSYEAEVYRLKGELTLAQSSVQRLASSVQKEAEECFHKAIEIARKQQAKSLELRAVMSLSRLWQNQGKKDEARQMLAKIYGWFTEGFDTKDLQEAKALLEKLT